MRRSGTALVAIGVAAALAGCGGDDFADQSAEEILAAAASEMSDLTSVRITIGLVGDGREAGSDTQLAADGDCLGTFGFGDGVAEVRGVGDEVWIRAGDDFWRSFGAGDDEAALEAVRGKWLPFGAEPEMMIGGTCDLEVSVGELVDEIAEEEGDSGFAVDGTEVIDGESVVRLKREDDDGETFGYVRVEEPHYLVRFEGPDGDEAGSVNFSEFNEEFEVRAPAEDEIVDLRDLGG
ncbi:hypothetical protein [Nocardioides sp. R-C-SC26]|uniref:hypothetical protein n=1 Tax=Nocardioides sp. R-C-SC26 TaxID=2870414 RepID=UPI001E35F0DD|nr:hypothetical protein [Nocardioides sp. R-C-SC26]